MQTSPRRQIGAGFIPIPMGCLTAFLMLPLGLVSLPVVWLVEHLRRSVR